MKTGNVLVKPLMTEKATTLANNKVYAFEVGRRATKTEIAAALESLYGVKVDKVRVVTRPGRMKRSGRRMNSQKMTAERKVAYITVKEGKIDLFPQA